MPSQLYSNQTVKLYKRTCVRRALNRIDHKKRIEMKNYPKLHELCVTGNQTIQTMNEKK